MKFLKSWILVFLIVVYAVASAANKNNDEIQNDEYDNLNIPYTILNNDEKTKLPLIGLGVGNLQHNYITNRIIESIQQDKKILLFDTAHASKNEKLVKEGIKYGIKGATSYLNKKTSVIHVITKVYYTHLGYDRTILSVKESLQELKYPNIHVHILIHWPRCDDNIVWMNCEQEEEELPAYVKKVGPPPHLNKETAFIESWKALEDIYLGNVKLGTLGGFLGHGLPKVASIGVSNFAVEDFKLLESAQRITPMILQGNIWSLLFDPYLMEYIREKNIHFQAYNAVHRAFYGRDYSDAPNALLALKYVAEEVAERSEKTAIEYTSPQLVLKWLVQNDISIIPRTSSPERLAENSAVSIAAIPMLTELEQETIRNSIAALLSKEDLLPPMAEFQNRAEEGFYNIFWLHEDNGEEVLVKERLGPGEIYNANTQRGHKFVAYHSVANIRKEFVVQAKQGQQQRFDLHNNREEL